MKKILFTTVISCFFFTITDAKAKIEISNSRPDTLPTSELVTFLQQMNVQSYYGKAVDSFLLAIPTNFYNQKVYGGSNSQGALFRANYLTVDFTPNPYGVGVKIYVREFTHMNRYSSTATWDVTLFRKEKIFRIDVYKNQNICINGDCMN